MRKIGLWLPNMYIYRIKEWDVTPRKENKDYSYISNLQVCVYGNIMCICSCFCRLEYLINLQRVATESLRVSKRTVPEGHQSLLSLQLPVGLLHQPIIL